MASTPARPMHPRDEVDVPTVLQPAPAVDARPSVKGALRRRLIGRIVLVFVAVGVLVSALSYGVLNRSFDAFERAAAAQTLSRVQTVLRRDAQSLSGVVVDYAYWDELYDFMANPRTGFMDENFTVASLRNLQVHAAVLFDSQGAPLAARFSHQGALLEALPDSWLAQLRPLSGPQGCMAAGHGLVWGADEPLSVAHAPIRNTAVDLPARGCFVLVRHLDSAYRASVAELVGVTFKLLSAPGLPMAQHRLSEGHWFAQGPLDPWPASLSIEHPADLDSERTWIMTLMAGGQVVLSLAAIAVLYALLHLMVVRRLTRFSSLADDYRRTHDSRITWPVRGQDEIDNLGHSLNELVKQVHWQVEHQATHDSLTGLLNRQGLERVLCKLPFQALQQRSRTSCLLMIDLDNFKVINDGFGHDVGNALLRHMAAQLTAAVRDVDVVARLGGDEFAILLHGVYRDAVDELVQRVLVFIRAPLTHAELELATTGSVGLAFCDGVSSSAELLRNADLAMYQAKQQGRDVCVHFNEGYKVEAQRRNMLAQALRAAVRDNTLQAVFQPVVDVVSQRVVGIEALARWSLDGEAISPAEFIPIAEEVGLIGKLGLQVLARSCAMVARLRALGHDIPCSVNLSMRQFEDINLVADVTQTVQAHGLPAASIRLEITESLVAQSDAALLLAMAELHKRGFDFLLDDFGTGQSSLYRLQSLPFQTIKIDRSFVVPLARGDDVMVRTVRELARDLHLQVVAEGVETQTQLDALVALDVHRIQGYFIARPMSDTALLHWLGTTSWGAPEVAGAA